MASERPPTQAKDDATVASAGAERPSVAGSGAERPSTQAPTSSIPPPAASEEAREAREAESVPPPQEGRPPSDRPSEPPQGEGGREPRRNRFENILPGLIRRGIEKGIEAGMHTFERSLETGRGTTDAVRGVFSEVRLPRDVANAVGRALTEAKLPREIASAVFSQLDETKNDVLRIVAREVRDFLEATDLADELKAALTSLSFEIRTEVRFIPNDAGTGIRPDLRARSRVKRATREREPRPSRTSSPPGAHAQEEQEEHNDAD
jgi:hypothetical protein